MLEFSHLVFYFFEQTFEALKNNMRLPFSNPKTSASCKAMALLNPKQCQFDNEVPSTKVSYMHRYTRQIITFQKFNILISISIKTLVQNTSVCMH